jgi:hypothetical protein
MNLMNTFAVVWNAKITLTPPEIIAYCGGISRIGVNLNQQVRAMNTAIASGQYISNIDERLPTVTEVTLAVQKLHVELIVSEVDPGKNS